MSNNTYTASYPMRYGSDPDLSGVPSAYGMAYRQQYIFGSTPGANFGSTPGANFGAEGQVKHYVRMKLFYQHLLMHPSFYLPAQRFAKKIAANDADAQKTLAALMAQASAGDRAASNTCRCIAVVMKFENMVPKKGAGAMVSGALPSLVGIGQKLVKFALSPVAWALGATGRGAHWAGNTLTNLGHAL